MNRTKTLLSLSFGLATTLILSSCSLETDTPEPEEEPQEETCIEIKDTPASGIHRSIPFTYVDGFAEPSPFTDGALDISLFPALITGDKCSTFNSTNEPDTSVIISVPFALGTYDIEYVNKVTFRVGITNFTSQRDAKCGTVEILTLNDSIVSGRVAASIEDGENEISGTFTVDFCE